MANLQESAVFDPGVYQIETTDEVLGGPNGISNRQAKSLANRTNWLKQKVEGAQSGLAAHEAAADPHPQYLTHPEGDSKIAAAVAALVNSSPGTLDTLAELAKALGDDPNFATTITNALALKAPLASPALTGTPTAPTAAQFDNTQKVATTEFVQRALGNHAGVIMSGAASGLTLSAANVGQAIDLQAGFSGNVTLPPSASCRVGASLVIWNGSGAKRLLVPSGSDTIWPNGGAGLSSVALENGESASVTLIGSGWMVTGGSAQLRHASSFASSLATNGYQKLPSGLIIQWGSTGVITGGGGSGVISYPIAFPISADYVNVIGVGPVTVGNNTNLAINAKTNTNFSFLNSYISNEPFNWMAIGR